MTETTPASPLTKNLLVWILGGWMFASLFMFLVATKNFALLKPEVLPKANEVFAQIPAGEPRVQALRYTASEINRLIFDIYAKAQFGIAIAAMLLALAAKTGKVTTTFILVAGLIAATILFYFVPDITARGRLIDFMPRDPKPPEVAAFQLRHGIEMAVELVKVVMIAFASIGVLRTKR